MTDYEDDGMRHSGLVPTAAERRADKREAAVKAELTALRERVQREWQPIETAPKHTELLVYRRDAGIMLGIYTSPDQFTPESHWDDMAAELGDSFETEDWFLFCWDGAQRADADLVPTHWRPLPAEPITIQHTKEQQP